MTEPRPKPAPSSSPPAPAAPVPWKERPAPPPPPSPSPWRALLGPALLLAAAGLIWRGGRVRTAEIMAVAAIVITTVMLAWPRARAVVVRVTARVTEAVAWALSYVLLVPAYFLVMLPLGLLMRLFGGRPLDLSRDATRSSYWTVRTKPRASHPERMFADQRTWQPVGFSASQRRRVVWRTVVATTLIEAVLVGAVIYVVDARRNPPPAELGGASAVTSGPNPATAEYDWAADAHREQGRLSFVYTPFTGASIRDFEGTYFNVKNRVRKSYETPLAATSKPLDVWFFGGSTMFGFDLLRDEHTIPSEIVRLAERDGIPIRARNYGMAGYVNYQESVLLSLLVTADERPDLVVFYDGVNDSSMALLNAYGGLNPSGEPGDLGALTQRLGLTKELPGASAKTPSPLGLRPSAAAKPTTVESIVASAAGVYRQGFDLSRLLADRYGFRVAHFWQPDYYTKVPLDPAEQAIPLGLDTYRIETMTALWRKIREALPPEVVDISTALNGLQGPILSDSVHTNEKGSLAVSQAMYPHLRDQLRALQASR